MTNEDKIIKNKLGVLRLAEELGNVSQACRIMGYSRDSFYRFRELYAEHGEEGLREISRQKPNLHNRVAPEVEEAVVKIATDYPAYGQKRASNELKKRGIFVSPGGMRFIWQRHDLENFKKRLSALETLLAANQSQILTEAQLQALEKAQEQRETEGEIETAHPGYLGAQDTYYVGTIKGIGRIYQQTFIDTYSKVAFVKLYTAKSALMAADLLNDRVVPWFEQQDVPLLRILTDRSTEYCGVLQHHEYQLYLALEDIEHTRTKAHSPQTNGICERFHRTIQEEFYQVAFRKKLYTSLDELQADLDEWLEQYNRERSHSGKYCEGRTPLQTFRESKHLVFQKMLERQFEGTTRDDPTVSIPATVANVG
jgi:transposase InsO family protein